MKELFKYKSDIERLCNIYNVKSLYAFGSVLSDNFNPQSDIDFIVDFKLLEITQYADNYYAFKFSLEDMLKRPIDLLEEKAIKNPYFLQSIENQRELIYEN